MNDALVVMQALAWSCDAADYQCLTDARGDCDRRRAVVMQDNLTIRYDVTLLRGSCDCRCHVR